MKNNHRMFGGIAREMARAARAEAEDQATRERHAQEAEAHLDAPITRREVLDAIEEVAREYDAMGRNGTRDLLRKLAEALS